LHVNNDDSEFGNRIADYTADGGFEEGEYGAREID